MTLLRTRWAALGAAVAVTLGAGGIGMVSATNPGDALTFVPITPCRLFDTRPTDQVGPRSAPLGPGDVHTVKATGNNGNCTDIPISASAVSLNMTSVAATASTFLTVWAADQARPTASNLNPSPGAPPTPNGVIAALSSDGRFKVYNLTGNVHVLADVNGYYVDHNHDDRYYTKSGADDRFLTPADGDAAYLQPGDAALPPTNQSRWTGCTGGSMNTPDDGDNTFNIGNDPRGYIGSLTNGAQFYCPLDLPQGAQINGFRALLRDIGPTGSGQGLARCILKHMPLTGATAGDEITVSGTAVGTGLVGTNGSETPILLDDLMSPVIVDNENSVYYIKCDVFDGGSTTVGNLGIYLTQVRYKVGVVPGTSS